MRVPVYIFSYNRLRYLKNAIKSVERFYPYSKIYIVDDGSDDVDMLEFIQQNATVYNFIFPNSSVCGDRGGLYTNLNYCVYHAKQNGFQYVGFMFDDLQFVREWEEGTTEKYINFLSANKKRCYAIGSGFIPLTEKAIGLDSKLELNMGLFVPKKDCECPVYRFADGGFISVDNFISLMGKFEIDEKQNQKKAIDKSLIVGSDPAPYITRLPFQEFKRRGRNPKAIELYNIVSRRGFYPIKYMTEEQILKLKSSNKVPYAEEWLHSDKIQKKIWSFWGDSFGLELLEEQEKKDLAEKLFWIDNNITDLEQADNMIIELCEKHLYDTLNSKNPPFSYN